MLNNFFKSITVVSLLAMFLFPQNFFAQELRVIKSDAENVIKKYEQGNLKNFTFEEKQIISEYLESTQKVRPHIQNPFYSPEAVIFSESFDDVTFPPTNWLNTQISGTGLWNRVTAGTSPTTTPHTGAGMARFNCYNYPAGTDAILVTPSITIPTDVYRVSFWMYRDGGFSTNLDRVLVHYNTAANLTGATLLGTINRSTTQVPVVASEGWYNYTFDMPVGTGGAAYIIFEGISAYGNNIFIDDVVVEDIPSGPPAPAVVVNPLDAETDVLPLTTLDWIAGGGAAPTGYRLYFGTDGGGITLPTNIENNTNLGLVTQYTPVSSLTLGTL